MDPMTLALMYGPQAASWGSSMLTGGTAAAGGTGIMATLGQLGSFGAGMGQLGGGLSSLFGGSSDSKSIRKQGNEMMKLKMQDLKNQKWWYENFGSKAIQNTVADARAAGLHPLFALGGGAMHQPTFTAGSNSVGPGNPGVDRGAAIASVFDGLSQLGSAKELKEVRNLGLREARANVRYAEAQATWAETQAKDSALARTAQVLQNNPQVGLLPNQPTEPGSARTVIRIPYTQEKNSSRTAGKQPAFDEVELAPGVSMPFLREDYAEFWQFAAGLGAMLLGGGADLARAGLKQAEKLGRNTRKFFTDRKYNQRQR